MVGEGEEGAGVGIILPRDEMHESHRAVVEINEGEEFFPSAIGPGPAGIDFVVDDPMMHTSKFAIGPGPTFGH